MHPRTFRIFLSSPGDVTPERDRAKRVFEKLDAELRGEASFELVRWEDSFYSAAADFQSQIPRPSECDAVLCILWKRLGTPLPPDLYSRADGSPYGSGTEYEFEEAYSVARERRVPDILVYRKTEKVTFDAETAALEQAQWQSLHAFWDKWFRSAEGHFTAAFDTFGSTDEFEVRLERHLRQWLNAKLARDVVWPPENGSPFRGLRSFQEEHAPVFFGRRRAVEQARALLAAAGVRGTPYLLILGMSGSGKSSLVQAGLIPRLKLPGAVAGVDLWRVVTLRPGELGDDPAGSLARRLLDPAVLPELAEGDFGKADVLARQFADPVLAPIPIRGALDRAVRRAKQTGAYERPLQARLLIYVDQLEELFALAPEARGRFSVLLDAFVGAGTAWVVTTLRSDAYPAYQDDQVLVSLKDRGAHLDLRPPGEAEIGEIIRRPAEAAGIAYEKDGARELDRLLEEAAGTPGSLPLLEFTLDELYKSHDRERQLLTLAGYDALGGLEGAIEKRAEDVYSRLGHDARATLPRVLRALVRVDEDGRVRRAYADLPDLRNDPDRRALVDAFIEARLFTTGEHEGPVLSVAHEALFTQWARARQHIETDRSDISLRAWLQTEAERWHREHGRSRERLLERGARLEEGADLVRRRRDELPGVLVEFVERSVASARRLTRTLAAAAAIAVLLISIAAIAATVQWRQAEAERQRAVATLAQSDFLEGTRLIEEGDAARGLAYLARAMRGGSTAAGARAWDLLARRAWPRLVAPPMRHDTVVRAAGFSPDGTRIVTASADGTARVWGAATGKPLTEPMRHEGWVNAAGFSPDGTRIVTASADRTARVWDAATGEPLTEPMRHEGGVNAAGFSPDGRRIVTASFDRTARVWDAATGELVTEPMRHEGGVAAAAFSPDGTRIVTASSDRTAGVWDAATGELVTEPMRHEGGVAAAAFSADGTRVVTASADGTARVWDAATGRLLPEPMRHDGGVAAAAFSPDTTRIVTASLDRTARVWDATTGAPLTEPMRHDGLVVAAGFSTDGTRIATASLDRTARVWDAATGEPLTEPMRHQGWVNATAFSPDGMRILTASNDRTARVWDAASGGLLIEPMRHADAVTAAGFSAEGARVVTASADGTARVWDAATGEPLTEPIRHEGWVNAAAFSPDGSRIVTASEDRTAQVWDAATGEPLTQPIRHEGGILAARFSPDGSRIVTGSADYTARVWDAATGEPLTEPMRHREEVRTAAFSPDDTRILTASADRTAKVWDAATGEPLTEAIRHEGWLLAASFSPDGTRIVTASEDRTAQVWDAASGHALAERMRHEETVNAAEFSPDGTRIVTASVDRTARVWDAATGTALTEPIRHEGGILSAAFSPDGTRIVTASEDRTAQVWDAASGDALAEPLRHEHHVVAAGFSPDGSRIITGSHDSMARVWDAPAAHPPAWAADLAEALAGYRLSDQGVVEPLADRYERHAEIQRRSIEATGDDPWTFLLRWLFTPPSDRTISPLSKLTVREFVARRLDEGTEASLREALAADPLNEEVRRRLAEMTAAAARAPE